MRKQDYKLSNQLRLLARRYIVELKKQKEIDPDKIDSVTKLLRQYTTIKRLEMKVENEGDSSFYKLLESKDGPPIKRHD